MEVLDQISRAAERQVHLSLDESEGGKVKVQEENYYPIEKRYHGPTSYQPILQVC